MLYREIIAACSEIHTEHINTLCEQNVEFFSVKPGSNLWGWKVNQKQSVVYPLAVLSLFFLLSFRPNLIFAAE